MNRVMIDLEAIASGPRAGVIAIGACVFHDHGTGATFERLIDPKLAAEYGERDEATIEWWGRQNPDVRARMFSGTAHPVAAANEFAEWYRAQKAVEVWANAPSFDCVILQHLFAQTGVKCPWQFRHERCVRTVFAEAKEYGFDYSKAYEGTAKHDAVADCLAQARAVTLIRAHFHPRQDKLPI